MLAYTGWAASVAAPGQTVSHCSPLRTRPVAYHYDVRVRTFAFTLFRGACYLVAHARHIVRIPPSGSKRYSYSLGLFRGRTLRVPIDASCALCPSIPCLTCCRSTQIRADTRRFMLHRFCALFAHRICKKKNKKKQNHFSTQYNFTTTAWSSGRRWSPRYLLSVRDV